ncbi:helix-turn-helix transcriptional regulator [Catenulispora pinistramenti]|uniref:helix-turn-helix transcriptional regulator n=1 Tax=Catenulispora pinistramenti TaxID=2705254 RepID=UPI001E2F7E82|nr:helix-turn-helix transcriptional regulator [Catenulispora pinistramenti]
MMQDSDVHGLDQGESSEPGIAHTTRQSTLGEFLTAMRARLAPEDVGLRTVGRRRTPGLRRQEVAELAAVSIDWYIRLEQGRVGAPGAAVLDALAGALRLTPVEREYLHLTARGETPPRRLPDRRDGVSPSVRAILDGMPMLPAYVLDHCFDVLAHNAAATAMFGAGFGHGPLANVALLLFLDEDTRRGQLCWEQVARETVGALRANAAKYPDDSRLQAVIARLRAESPEFAAWWGDHTVSERGSGVKRVAHPVAGVLTVAYDMLAAPGAAEQRLVVLTPVGAVTGQRLRALVTASAPVSAPASAPARTSPLPPPSPARRSSGSPVPVRAA